MYVSVYGWNFNAQLLLCRIHSNPALKGLVICRTRPRPRTRTRPQTRTHCSHWIAYKQCMKPFLPKATTNEAGNWFVRKVAGLPLERIFRRWWRELFLVNQSVLLFSWNSAQVSRDGGGICHKYDASVKSGVHIYPCISSSFSFSV